MLLAPHNRYSVLKVNSIVLARKFHLLVRGNTLNCWNTLCDGKDSFTNCILWRASSMNNNSSSSRLNFGLGVWSGNINCDPIHKNKYKFEFTVGESVGNIACTAASMETMLRGFIWLRRFIDSSTESTEPTSLFVRLKRVYIFKLFYCSNWLTIHCHCTLSIK